MIAALYVRTDGPYANRPGVDLWDEKRDARLYDGPHPVVAHVRRWGGVLEHPEGSRAWEHFGLPEPRHGAGWVRSLFDNGWSCSVDQGRYGHKARKRSWLYYSGRSTPPELDWTPATSSVWVCSGPGGRTAEERAAKGITLLSKREHSLTPVPFAELLLSIARNAQQVAA
jgi:hypothetical protein